MLINSYLVISDLLFNDRFNEFYWQMTLELGYYSGTLCKYAIMQMRFWQPVTLGFQVRVWQFVFFCFFVCYC